ncbi:hypothetical protein ACFL2V_00700 [Pseudomonadota bacterium]
MSDAAPTKDELKLAQLPHQLFLFNSIGNHVLLTVITVSVAMSNPLLTLLIPIVSAIIVAFTLIRGGGLKNHASLLVRCHWGIAMRRTRMLLIGYAAIGTAATIAWLLYTQVGIMKELAFALAGGLGILPFMVMVLGLTIIESETLNHAGDGFSPDWARRRFGTEAEVKVLEEELAANAAADA